MPISYQLLRRPFTRSRQALINLALIDASYSGGWMGLPQELTDMIFGYLRTDWAALVSCSLTSRAFFLFRETHYPRAVTFGGPEDISVYRQIHEVVLDIQPKIFPCALPGGRCRTGSVCPTPCGRGRPTTHTPKPPTIRFEFSEICVAHNSYPHPL